MSLSAFYMVERFAGESLSSWGFRMRHGAKRTFEGQKMKSRFEHVDFDPDSGQSQDNLSALAEMSGLSLERLERLIQKDPPFSQPIPNVPHEVWPSNAPWVGSYIIPLHYKSAYCYQCLEEGVRMAKLPIIYEAWRYVLHPFCVKHECLLRDVPGGVGSAEDFALVASKHYWERTDEDMYNRIARDHIRLKLGMRVQFKIFELWMGGTDLASRLKNIGFILTLFRLVLSTEYNWAYSKFPRWHPDAKRFPGIYSAFFNLPLQATAIGRARALFIVGLLLGWITEQEATVSDFWDAFAPKCALTIWRQASRNTTISDFVSRELGRYETEQLSRATLVDWEWS